MSEPLKLVIPAAITDTELVSTNVPEDSAPLWQAAGVYAVNDVVHLPALHRRYRSLLGTRATVTISIANPGAVMWAAHGQAEGTPVVLATTGTLPTGLAAGTVYDVRNPTADAFGLSAAVGGAVIATSGTQTGLHSVTANAQRNRYPATDAKAWQDIAPTNSRGMFDRLGTTKTTNNGPIRVKLKLGAVASAAALVGMVGDRVRLRVVDPVGGTVYDRTNELLSLPVLPGYWEFFYGRRTPVTLALHLQLPPYPSAEVWIDIEGAYTECHNCLVGDYQEIAIGVLAGAEVGINDFGTKEFDEFGNLDMVERGFSDKASFDLLLDQGEVDAVAAQLKSLRGKTFFWIGSSRYEATSGYGIYRSYSIGIVYDTHSKSSIQFEGLTKND